jgi:hypothetical protein
MNNKIKDLINELNADNEICPISYKTNGYWEAISIDELHLWDDQNYNEEYVRQQVGANLLRISGELYERANEILVEEVGKYMDFWKSKIKEEFPQAKVSYFRQSPLRWKIVVSGEYDENKIDDIMDVFTEDFNYIFQYAKLEVEW